MRPKKQFARETKNKDNISQRGFQNLLSPIQVSPTHGEHIFISYLPICVSSPYLLFPFMQLQIIERLSSSKGEAKLYLKLDIVFDPKGVI